MAAVPGRLPVVGAGAVAEAVLEHLEQQAVQQELVEPQVLRVLRVLRVRQLKQP